MNKFKVGDEVVVLTQGDDSRIHHGFREGTIGTVTGVEYDGVFVDVLAEYLEDKEIIQTIASQDLELVSV